MHREAWKIQIFHVLTFDLIKLAKIGLWARDKRIELEEIWWWISNAVSTVNIFFSVTFSPSFPHADPVRAASDLRGWESGRACPGGRRLRLQRQAAEADPKHRRRIPARGGTHRIPSPARLAFRLCQVSISQDYLIADYWFSYCKRYTGHLANKPFSGHNSFFSKRGF